MIGTEVIGEGGDVGGAIGDGAARESGRLTESRAGVRDEPYPALRRSAIERREWYRRCGTSVMEDKQNAVRVALYHRLQQAAIVEMNCQRV
jgi:hypothetical protein